jgi:hypothetical protein
MSTTTIEKGKMFHKKRKQIPISARLLTWFLTTGVYEKSKAAADQENIYPPIVSNIAKKFGLSEVDVYKIFLQEMNNMWKERKRSISDRLEQAAEDGKITKEQKQKILAKRDEILADRVTKRRQFRNEMEQWMINNKIDTNALMPYMGLGNTEKNGLN